MDVAIRAATAGDAALILRFIRELAVYERAIEQVEVDEDTLRAQLSAPRPPFECAVAELDGAPVGFALYFQTYSTWKGRPGLWLEELYVIPAARSRGVAGAMLSHLGRVCRERGYARLELAALDWNELATDFYRNRGAIPLSEWTRWRFTGEALCALAVE